MTSTSSSSSASLSSAPNQMQVRVTFYTIHDPQSVLMILKNDCALEQIAEKARDLFPAAEYRLFYGDVNGPIYEFTNSEQVMSKIRISTFSRTPQLFVRLEPRSSFTASTKKSKESKRNSLKRIEQNQEQTLKSLSKLTKEFDRVTKLEKAVADLQNKSCEEKEPRKRRIQNSKHSATCDACLGDIIGHRYKCLECADYDLCEKCEKNSVHYEHAMIRIVCPRKTCIPEYVTSNAPNSVFPQYMRSNDIIIDIPLDIPLSHQAPSAEDFKKYSGETRAALKASAALLKSTFQSVSKGFLDLADGAQSGMDKKLFEKEKAEAEFEKFADTMETMARHVGQKYFPATTPEDKKEEDAPNNSFFNMSSEKWTPTNEPKHIRKSKKKFSFKKAAERLNTNSVLAKMAKEETEKRTDESAAELRKKLSELNLKGSMDKTESAPNDVPVMKQAEPCSPYETLLKQYLQNHAVFPTTTPVTTPGVATPTAPEPHSEPVSLYPSKEIEEFLIRNTEPTSEVQVSHTPNSGESLNNESTALPIQKSSSPSLHSSFENISSDFESIGSSWELSNVVEQSAERALALTEEIVNEVLGVTSAVVNTVVENTAAAAPVDATESLAPLDAVAEKTFDHLLEMGFEYNVVVSAIKENGPVLDDCLRALLRY